MRPQYIEKQLICATIRCVHITTMINNTLDEQHIQGGIRCRCYRLYH